MEKETIAKAFKSEDERTNAVLEELRVRINDGSIEDVVIVGFNRVKEITVLTTVKSKELVKTLLKGVSEMD